MWVKMPNPERSILRAGMKFTDATQTARDTKALVADGILKGASIGFIPKDSKFDNDAKKAFEADFADMGVKAPQNLEWYIPSCELCEWSIVSVPSNMDTLKNKLTELDPYLRTILSTE
jgi:phage head maturation protease